MLHQGPINRARLGSSIYFSDMMLSSFRTGKMGVFGGAVVYRGQRIHEYAFVVLRGIFNARPISAFEGSWVAIRALFGSRVLLFSRLDHV